MYILLALVIISQLASSTLMVRTGDQIDKFDTSLFVYYGQHSRTVSDAEGVYIPGTAFYEAKTERQIKGMAVVSDLEFASCNLDYVYSQLDEWGALALIVISNFPKEGTMTYYHESWSPTSVDRPMLLVSTSFHSIGEKRLETWRGSMAGLRFNLTNPHDDDFQRLFGSWTWTILFRTLLPAAALVVAAIAQKQAYGIMRDKERRSLSKFSVLVCVTEGFCMIMTAIMLISGLFGPVYFPYGINYTSTYEFMEITQLMNFFIALSAKEKTRIIVHSLPQRSLLKAYPVAITVTGTCFVFLGPPILWVVGNLHTFGTLRAASFTCFQLFVTVHFYACAKSLSKPLSVFMKRHGDKREHANFKLIDRFLRWVHVLVILLIAQISLIVVSFFFMYAGNSKDGALVWFLGHFLYTALRISVSFAQLVVTKPGSPTIFELFGDSVRRCFYGNRVQPDNSSGITSSNRLERRPQLRLESTHQSGRILDSIVLSPGWGDVDSMSEITDRENTSGVLKSESNSRVESSSLNRPNKEFSSLPSDCDDSSGCSVSSWTSLQDALQENSGFFNLKPGLP